MICTQKLAGFLLLLASCHAAAEPWVVGIAYSATTGEELYRELHTPAESTESMSGKVEYVDTSGTLIAQKSLDYDISLTAPAVQQIDLRSQTRFVTRHEKGTLVGGFQRDGGTLRTERISLSSELIVDAGFDPFVRQHWKTLLRGASVGGRFYVPSRLETVRISIKSVPSEECAPIPVDVLCLEVRPAGLLRVVGLFLEPLQLAYDAQSRRLLQFKGTSNLADNEGKAQEVLIRYEYSDSSASNDDPARG